MGDHRWDDKLPDLSPAALAAREKELRRQRRALARIAPAGLDEEVDKQILADAIALELLYLGEIRDWEWDPRLHDSFPWYDPREVVAGRISDIVHDDFAPEAERRRSVAAQLAALPRFLAQERKALTTGRRHPPRVYLYQAIKDNRGRIELFQTEVKEFTAPDPAAEAARAAAVTALGEYQRFLENDLPRRADGDWRLGAALYRKKFPLALQTRFSTEEVVRRAEAEFRGARRDLYAVARQLHARLWPAEKEPPEQAEGTEQRRVIERVKEEISRDHCRPEELVEAHGRDLDALRAFIEKHGLVSLPPRETLSVEPMPAFKRGSSAAEYLAPGVLERRERWRATYYVDPIDPSWPVERVESYLRGQNTYEVQLTAAREAYPGHHTQHFHARKDLDPVRAVLWSPPMEEGWAVYGEGLMVGLGWGGERNDRFRFYEARGRMIVAANAILDIRLQTGRMGEAEAVRFMVEEGFQERAMAEKKLLRAQLDSTQLVQYFLGQLEEIRDLERDHRRKVGAAWTQRAFDEALVGHGSVGVRFLRRYLLG